MAGPRNSDWWWNKDIVDPEGELDTRILDTGQPTTATMGQSQFGTNTGQCWVYAPAGGADSTREPDAEWQPTTVKGGGFAIIPVSGHGFAAYWHDIDNPPYPQARKINAGQWRYRWAIRNVSGGPDLNAVFGPGFNVFKRKGLAGGPYTYELLWQTKTPNYQGIPTSQGGDITFDWTDTHPRVEFLAPDETLYIEAWHHGKGVGALGNGPITLAGRQGQAVFQSFFPQINVPAIGDLWSRASNDVAPATDGLDEQHAATRPINETTSISENTVRELIVVRRPTDNVSGADSLEEQVHSYRATVDSLSIDESSTRSVAVTRSPEDSVLGIDAIALAYDGGRLISDSIPLTEVAERQFDGKRSLDETLNVSDIGERKITATRFPNETLSVGDQPERSVSLNRELSDSSPATDEVSRQVSASRPVSDAVAEGGGDIIRKSIYVFDD